jgi:hypothetical protein
MGTKSSLLGLQQARTPKQGRNANLNDAYQPPWEPVSGVDPIAGPQGDTRIDPFAGTEWGQFLDTLGASDPGGAHLGRNPLPGLPTATAMPEPGPVVDGPYASAPVAQLAALSGKKKKPMPPTHDAFMAGLRGEG